MSRTFFRMSCFVTIAISIFLRYLVSPAPDYGSIHDDELMVRLASNIIQGKWLGNYADVGNFTLSKPAGYPLFLAWSHFLPWAPTITVHIILLTGILLVARELRALKIQRSHILLFVIFCSFFPQWFSASMSRIYRDGFLAALTFLGIGLSLYLGRLLSEYIEDRERGGKKLLRLLATTFLNGFTLSWVVATKPGWYPMAITMVLLSVRILLRWKKLNWKLWLPQLAIVSCVASLGFISIIGYVALQNKNHYGLMQLDSFANGSFPKVLSKWSSVQSDDQRKYLLVDSSQRARVYSISPAALKLRPYLETAEGQDWRAIACASPLKICDESSAWFNWDLRDAVREAGFDKNAQAFENFLAQISRDISKACSSKKLICDGNGLAPGILSVSDISKREIVDAYATAFDWILYPDIGPAMRGGVPTVEPKITKMWDSTIKGLPPRTDLNNYRAEATAIGNFVALIQRIYNSVFPVIFLLAIIALFLKNNRVEESKKLRVVSLFSVIGALLFVGQLALLEASSGLYVSAGKTIYLLPVFPFILVFVGFSLMQIQSTRLVEN